MAPRVVGAGLGRTGTHSLKIALEQLLGGTCHHMVEVFQHPDEMPVWEAAAEGTMPDWQQFLAGYSATADWPSAAFWPEISAAFPDAIVLLSERDPDAWYRSAHNTIFVPLAETMAKPHGEDPWADMIRAVFGRRFTEHYDDAEAAKAAFVANNERARAEIDPARLVVWTPADGWDPICKALGVAVPDTPFPVTNTTADFREMLGLPPV